MVASPLEPPHEQLAALPRVLIVDDDALVLRSLQRAMASQNVHVVAMTDVHQAMRIVETASFDAVLCDIRMPKMSGLAFARFVRSLAPEVPILLMTGDPQLDSALEAIEVGILEYLPKPIEPAKLRSAVTRAIKLSRFAKLRREAQDAIVLPDSQKVFGFEALLRSREKELPTPPHVIEAAEVLGRTSEVGAKVRRLASEAFATAPGDALLFLNILPLDLLDDDLYETGTPLSRLAERIVLEVTERADLAKVKDALPRIQRLRSMGYRVAVDDLGAGYAGLSSFATLEPEFTKLDMSLVRGAYASSVKQRVIGSIATLCRDLGSRVVAEGIETPEDSAALSALGCELMQGYYFARPGPAFPGVDWH
jgi:EAL domain-containing protein (putative c-di-GMP-specific phosphodiesterase class I)